MGDTLETYGTGNLAFGYYGGVMDAATGLLYVGNGQYYDPATGRFLTRSTKPNQNNPYTPFDPMGALFAPLGLMALVYGRRKKGSKWAVLLVILSFAVVTGMTLSACGNDNPPVGEFTATGTFNPVTGTATGTLTTSSGTFTGTVVGTPGAPLAIPISCPAAPISTPTPVPTVTIFFGGSDGHNLANEHDPLIDTAMWVKSVDKVVPFRGGINGVGKKNQANEVDINAYKDVNLILIGYSAGGDTALIFADKYRKYQQTNNGKGRITDVAVLAGTMSGNMTDTGTLGGTWPDVLNNLLLWGTDIYILNDDSNYGDEASGHIPPAGASGTFFYDERQETQSHVNGTNNSETYKDEVFSWFSAH